MVGLQALAVTSPDAHLGNLENEVADIDLLHAISTELIAEQDSAELYGKIVDAAVAIMGSQFGTIQRICPANDESGHGGELGLLSSRGLPPEAIQFWRWVRPTAHSSCTAALKRGGRAIIPDFEEWDEIAGTEDLNAFRRTGIRSAQTTPLRSRNGTLLGMLSTHWNRPHEPSERDLRLLDILARQAADLLERTIADEAIREREIELERTCAELRDTQELQKMLADELSHRVKNMLATVQAIAVQTLRTCDNPEEFVESFGGRIQSMGRVHSQLSTNEWKGTQLHDIVRDQMKLGPVDESQISAAGPHVYLNSNVVPNMAMMLHELGTNSLKYGALSTLEGVVSIDWQVTGAKLDMVWTERGGPKVGVLTRRGFGTKLIEASGRSLGGIAKMSVEAESVRWDICFPLGSDHNSANEESDLAVKVASISALSEPTAKKLKSTLLAGKRLLVVEDEPLLAMNIAEQLEDAGAHIVGPVGTTVQALSLIEEFRLDGALLDANLAGYPVGDIAASLALKDIPFVFVTGYGKDALPADFRDVELLAKPFDADALVGVAVKNFV